MNKPTRGTLLGLAATAVLGVGAADAGKIDECLECHFEDDFKGELADDIAELIKDSAGADSGHPADLSGLTEAEIAEIAAQLAKGGEE